MAHFRAASRSTGLSSSYNWNPDPGSGAIDQYRTLDDVTFRAARQSGFSPKAVSASPDQQVPLTNPELVHLSSAYYEFTFDGSVSTLAFLNGFTYELKIENIDGAQVFTSTELDGTEPVKKYGKVHALIKRQGKDWEVADWSKTPSSIMCLDDPNDRVERLVIILSNSDHDRANLPIKPVGSLGPRLWASNIGCWKWQGTATWVNPIFQHAEHDRERHMGARTEWWRPWLVTAAPRDTAMASSPSATGRLGAQSRSGPRATMAGARTQAALRLTSPTCRRLRTSWSPTISSRPAISIVSTSAEA
ncbi:MAG: hypothetical protein IPO51_16100 [Dehalococcoidia bacterium]|nr:hypothetical protein [Dehalococcoidia bacterium]